MLIDRRSRFSFAVGCLNGHDRDTQFGQGGCEAADIVAQHIHQQLFPDRPWQALGAIDDGGNGGWIASPGEHFLEPAADEVRVAIWHREGVSEHGRHRSSELAAVNEDDAGCAVRSL